MEIFNQAVKITKKMLMLSKTSDEVKKLKKLNSSLIRKTLQLLRNSDKLSEKKTIQTVLCELKILQFKINQRLTCVNVTGMGLDNRRRRRKRRSDRVRWIQISSAFQSRILTAVIHNIRHKDPTVFLQDCVPLIKTRIRNLIKNRMDALKLNLVLSCDFFLPTTGEEDSKYFNTKNSILTRSTNIEVALEELFKNILVQVSTFYFTFFHLF